MMRTGWAVLLGLALLGCGGDDDDDDDGGGSCASAGEAICDAACDCRDGDACAIGEGGATISFDSPEDCRGLYVTLGCTGGGDATIDYAACTQAMAAAECNGDPPDQAVALPPECESTEE